MNIIPQAPNLSTPTVLNPHTETLRRENNQREIITQPAAAYKATAEKGVASDKERGRTSAQNNENIDFARLKEKAELANNAVSEQNQEQNDQQKNQQDSEHHQSAEHEANNDRAESYQQAQQTQQINELKARDLEVRTHERAHSAVGGAFTGSPNYSFEAGPDGKKYAVDGDVSVDLSRVDGDPRATIAKMQKVHAAALAPANPSVQDTRVAATAAQIILQAQSELLAEQGNKFVSENSASPAYVNPNSVLDGTQEADDVASNEQSFDVFINQTLEAQEKILPTRSEEVIQRADRITRFYSNITQAYEKPATYQFELTA